MQFQKDDRLYHRFFSEVFLYLYRSLLHYDDWSGVVIFPSRSLEPENTGLHRSLLNSPQIQRIYLDELGDPNQQPIGISLIQLTIAPEQEAIEQAQRLIARTQSESLSDLSRNEIIEVITTIAVYKFANLSRDEVEAMLGLNLKETRIYQEAREEGREEGREEMKSQMLALTVPLLLNTGLSVEQIAQQLQVDVGIVRQIADHHN